MGNDREKVKALFAISDGENDADRTISAAQARANARAARILAAKECPETILNWGKIHGIPNFAEVTWQDGFLAGLRAAYLEDKTDD
jgi:hypothetical protein